MNPAHEVEIKNPKIIVNYDIPLSNFRSKHSFFNVRNAKEGRIGFYGELEKIII